MGKGPDEIIFQLIVYQRASKLLFDYFVNSCKVSARQIENQLTLSREENLKGDLCGVFKLTRKILRQNKTGVI